MCLHVTMQVSGPPVATKRPATRATKRKTTQAGEGGCHLCIFQMLIQIILRVDKTNKSGEWEILGCSGIPS